MNLRLLVLALGLILATISICGAKAAPLSSGADLAQALHSMCEARPNPVVFVSDSLSLFHRNFHLQIEQGEVLFFEPLMVDSVQRFYAAFCRGKGRIRFQPPVRIEQDQLRRFFGSDSLDREVEGVFLLFDDSTYPYLRARCQESGERASSSLLREAERRREDLTQGDEYFYMFNVLRALLEPTDQPLLLVNCRPKDSDRLVYFYNPFSSEEVSLLREHRAPGEDYLELVNSYHEHIDESYDNINGPGKGRLAAEDYEIDATIDRNGTLFVRAEVAMLPVGKPTRMAWMYLHREIDVDSVLESAGEKVSFVRYESDNHKSPVICLFFDKEVSENDTLHLTFYYEGDVAKAQAGIFDVTAGGSWYPHVAYRQHATFDLTFRTPAEYEFLSVGEEAERRVAGDTLITRWLIGRPVSNVSFAIGPLTMYRFGNDRSGPVEVYYSEDVHERISWGRLGYQTMTKGIEKQVAEDVVGAVEQYSWMIGPRPFDRLRVAEVFSYHGEAFPGFLHLGLQTWFSTDKWHNERLFRAHETAHQWWGVAVGYESYHDQWLSEAFAQYYALQYVWHSGAIREARRMLEEWRDEIFSARDYGFGIKGAEAGPIILGPRTASSKTKGDYQLIVYKKGALVLQMLKEIVDPIGMQYGIAQGEFDKIMQRFYGDYKGREASTADFQRIVEAEVGQDMDWFFRQWVYGTGLPTYTVEWTKGRDEQGWFVDVKVQVEGVDSTFRMPVSVNVISDDLVSGWNDQIWISGLSHEFRIGGIGHEPEGLGFGGRGLLARVRIDGP